MQHCIEPAASGRAKCRGCGQTIAKGELRLGARFPNPFDAEDVRTLWFHLRCGVYARPEPFLEAVKETREAIADREELEAEARRGLEHPRLQRLRGVERAPTGRSSCRGCRGAIEKDSRRIALSFYDEEEGRFSPGGFLHLGCAKEYFGTERIVDRLRHFTPELERGELEGIAAELSGPAAGES